MKRTAIIATLGPASSKKAVIEKLIKAGVDVFRLNFSHGSLAAHKKNVRFIRELEKKLNKHVGILQDLQGPKIRVGVMPTEGVELVPKHKVTIVTKNVTGDSETIPTTYKPLPKDVRKGDVILLNDGYLELKVLSTGSNFVECRVVRGGILTSHKGINLRGVSVSAPSLTKKDIEDLRNGIELGVDYIAMSFVRSGSDVKELRRHIKWAGADVPIIAKIERPEAMDDLSGILDEADGVMVARGDLGVEMPPERVPQLQKYIIEQTNLRGKTVITATQMLESMIVSQRPTRAEASDVANAVYDVTGAVMLSGETAIGKWPVEVVRMMSRIVIDAEEGLAQRRPVTPSESLFDIAGFSGAVAYGAVRTAYDLKARAILTFTQSGTTAHLVSKYRPSCPIIGATLDVRVARRMSLFWGVIPLLFKKITSTESLLSDVDERLLETKLAKRGDVIVITSGVPVGRSGTTNFMKIHRVGESD